MMSPKKSLSSSSSWIGRRGAVVQHANHNSCRHAACLVDHYDCTAASVQRRWWRSSHHHHYSPLAAPHPPKWIHSAISRSSQMTAIYYQYQCDHYPPPYQASPQQRRHYLFLPTSWTELKLRMRTQAEKRTIQVRLFLEKQQQQYGESTSTNTAVTTNPTTNASSSTRAAVRAWMTRQRIWMQERQRLFRTRQAVQKWIRKRRRFLSAATFLARTAVVQPWRKRLLRLQQLKVLQQEHHTKQPPPPLKNEDSLVVAHAHTVMTTTLEEYSQADWFDATTGRPLTSRDETARFVNPWMSQSTDGVHSVATLLHWQWQRLQREWHEWFTFWTAKTITTTRPHDKSSISLLNDTDNGSLSCGSLESPQPAVVPGTSSSSSITTQHTPPNFTTSTIPPDHARFTWIGHSTCLLQYMHQGQPVTILTDPIFSDRSSPFSSAISFIGVPREVPPACTVDDLPPIVDFCLISHDHYDHLDKTAVQQLVWRVQRWIVPIGIGDWLHERANVARDRIVELEWWESVQLERRRQPRRVSVDANDNNNNNNEWLETKRCLVSEYPQRHPVWTDESSYDDETTHLWFTCCPAQHWGSRTFFDRNYRLWCSMACFLPMSSSSRRNNNNNSTTNTNKHFLFYFAGDTARPHNGFPLFEQIRDYLGQPVDLAALPIGAYAPERLSRDAHMNPAEACHVHDALESRCSVGVHWGTFCLSEEPLAEPAEWLARLVAERRQKWNVRTNFGTLRHGESIHVPATSLQQEQQPVLVLPHDDDEPEETPQALG
jgi:N-acyl-phosphatidylethanolamine-hydrolysing phospholipase D